MSQGPRTLTCDQVEQMMPELMDGELSIEDASAAAQHLATCDECRIVAGELSSVQKLSRRHGRLAMDPAARERIRQAIENSRENM